MPPDERTVYLVRHAQSQQNVATAKLAGGNITALADLIMLGYDAPLSSEGEMQLQTAAVSLKDFAQQQGVALVAHSPYQRAVHTARAVFPAQTQRMVELPSLHERTISEYFCPWLLDARVAAVRQWLDGREEKVIALVGHGQFFKRCLGARGVQPNVAIVQTVYSAQGGFKPKEGATECRRGRPSPPDAGEVEAPDHTKNAEAQRYDLPLVFEGFGGPR